VRCSIHLNYHLRVEADEVHDKAVNRHLPPELEAEKLPVSQMLPKLLFCSRL
jgi:hypothetical protein